LERVINTVSRGSKKTDGDNVNKSLDRPGEQKKRWALIDGQPGRRAAKGRYSHRHGGPPPSKKSARIPEGMMESGRTPVGAENF